MTRYSRQSDKAFLRYDGATQALFGEAVFQGLRVLHEALVYARDADRDAWDFAIECRMLQEIGLSRSDFRFLVCKGFVAHACEVRVSDADQRGRRFVGEAELAFSRQTCFVLTEKGFDFIGAMLQSSSTPAAACGEPRRSLPSSAPLSPVGDQPVFLFDVRELRFRNQVVKRFRLPSPNQEAILIAFHEESWPRHIDDPLPPMPDYCPKQRLMDTIKSLNRCQKTPLLHFSGDGRGEGVCWEPRGSASAAH